MMSTRAGSIEMQQPLLNNNNNGYDAINAELKAIDEQSVPVISDEDASRLRVTSSGSSYDTFDASDSQSGQVTSHPSASRARDAFRRAARRVVMANRAVKPYSAKGVPLLPRKSVVAALHRHALITDDESASDLPSESTIELAAAFVRDALANRNPNSRLAAKAGVGVSGDARTGGEPRRPSSMMERMLSSKWYRYAFQVIVFMHCLLACWESIPPSTETPPFSWTPGVFEAVFLAIYVIDQVWTFRTFGAGHYFDKKWELTFFVLLLLAIIDWFIYYPGGVRNTFRFSRPVRPFFGVAKRKSLRRLFVSVMRTVPKMIYVSALLFIVIFFYGTLGLQLFNAEQVPGYLPDDDNFNNWPNAALSIFVLTTTENYPNVANEAYHHRPYVATIFFVSALFIMLWLILPLILAIVYDHYLETHKVMARARRVKQYLSLVYAYQTLMGGDGDRELDRPTFVRLVQAAKPMSVARAEVMFQSLDVDRSGLITIAEFLRLPSVMQLNVSVEAPPARPVSASASCGTKLQARCHQIAKSQWFRYLVLVVVLAACAIGSVWSVEAQQQYDECIGSPMVLPAWDDNTNTEVTLQQEPEYGWARMQQELSEYARVLSGETPTVATDVPPVTDSALPSECAWYLVRWSSYAGLFLSALQVVELAIRSIGFVPTQTGICRSSTWLLASYWNLFDAAVVLWSVIGYIALLAGVHERASLSVADVFEVGQALPFLRLISLLPEVRAICQTVASILPLLAHFVGVYAAISYAFAIVGMGIFGGVTQTLNEGLCSDCQMWSYETFPLAWLALLQMTVGNNWNSVLYPNLVGIGTRWGAWYFMAYRFFMTDVFMNVIEGVMIEVYTRRQEESAIEAQAQEQVRRTSSLGQGAGDPLSPRISVQWQRELFDELSGDIATGGSSSLNGTGIATPRMPGVSKEELDLLDRALRKQQAALERQA